MEKNINQLIIEIKFKGDVSGTLPIFNNNVNKLNIKNRMANGYIFIPNKILLTNKIFKIEKPNEEIEDKLKKIFISDEALKKLYKESTTKKEQETNELLFNNIKFILNLYFKKKEFIYLQETKFQINSMQLLEPSANTGIDNIKNNIFDKKVKLSKQCSDNKNIEKICNYDNLENALIEDYKKNEEKFIKKIDPSINDSELNKKAYKEAIEKYKKGNQDQQIKDYANSIITKLNNENDLKRAGIKYIYTKNKGIFLNASYNILKVKIELDLTAFENIKYKKKIYIEHGDCNTKKNYIKSIWKRLTKKNKNKVIENKIKKWSFKNGDLKIIN